MQLAPCNLCGSQKNFEVYKDEKVRYVMCDKCTLVFLNPRLTEEEYKTFYERDYQSHRHNVTEYDHAISRLVRRNIYSVKEKRARDFEGYISKDSRVLEIGSGWGTLLRVVKDMYECDVAGVELSELAARVTREHYKLPVYEERFEDFVRGQGKDVTFDFIILTHTLEHMEDPREVLSEVLKILSLDGYLYIAVPNLASPDEPLDRFFHFEHTYYFSPFTLKRMLEGIGFKIVKGGIGPGDIRIIATTQDNQSPCFNKTPFHILHSPRRMRMIRQADLLSFEERYSKKRILRILENQRRTYRILRCIKKIAETLLPEKTITPFKQLIIKILRSLCIIEV